MAEEKALAAAQGSQGKSRDKGDSKRGETCNPRTNIQVDKITKFKISIKGRDKAKRERGRKETRNSHC